MAFNKKGSGFKGAKNAYYGKNKRGKNNGRGVQHEQRRYANTNRFDADDIYSMLPPSRPPKKRKNTSGGSMEGVVRPNVKFTKKNSRPYGKKNYGKKNYGNKKSDQNNNQNNNEAFKGKSFEHKPYKGKYKDSRQYGKNRQKNKRYNNFNSNNNNFDKKRREEPADNVQLNDGELIAGRNPVREALKAGRDLEKLLVQKGNLSGSAKQILGMAKDAGVKIQRVEKTHLDKLAKNHQGVVAFASAYKYAEIDDILKKAEEKNEKPFIVLLDQITDPHNLGAVIRSAVCTGAHGVIIPRRRAAGLTDAAVKAAAGAVEYIPVARVTNLAQTIKDLKNHGIWAYGMDMAGKPYAEIDFKGGVAIVIGSEGEGVSKSVKDACDDILSIPMTGNIGSFNASVAAGIIMHHVFTVR